jgi:hypothetical protein
MTTLIQEKPHNRKIYWIFDPFGAAGKSSFVKFQCVNNNALLLNWDCPRDLLLVRSKFADRSTIFFDLTRTIPKSVDLNEIYSTIESIKNGLDYLKNLVKLFSDLWVLFFC